MNNVKRTVNSILPYKNQRKLFLSLFVKSINHADSYGSDKWGVYYEQERIRLLVGNLIIFTLSDGQAWLSLDKETLNKSERDKVLLRKSDKWKWERGKYSEYKPVPSINGYYIPSKDLKIWTIIKKYHFNYIGKVAQTYEKLRINSQTKHSPELLIFLRNFLKCEIPEPNYKNPIKDIQDFSSSNKNLSETERETVVQSRLGQGEFRNKLINYWQGCAVTDCKFIPLLRASHIKPWRESNNEERLDKYNGLLLVPNLDSAFDNGLISFSKNGSILMSSKLRKKDQKKLGIKNEMKVRKIENAHKKYLEYHKENIFQK